MSGQRLPVAGAAPDLRLLQCNNFDLLRFLFACVVFLVHAHVSSGVQEFAIFSRYLSGLCLYLELQRQLPGQLCYFVAGAAVYYYFQHLRRHALLLTITSVAASNLQDWRPWAAVQPLALGTLVAFAACIVPSLGDFGRYGAYGIYIVHFPILQGLIAYGIFENATWAALLAVIALVMKAAVLLWHTIEKPFLRRLSHHVATNRG